jgi:hypothetical protein
VQAPANSSARSLRSTSGLLAASSLFIAIGN